MATASPVPNAAVVATPPSTVNNDKVKYNKKVLTGLGVSGLFLQENWSMLKRLCLIIAFLHKFYQWLYLGNLFDYAWQMFRYSSFQYKKFSTFDKQPHITDMIRDCNRLYWKVIYSD